VHHELYYSPRILEWDSGDAFSTLFSILGDDEQLEYITVNDISVSSLTHGATTLQKQAQV
jgi:hypothetical protein